MPTRNPSNSPTTETPTVYPSKNPTTDTPTYQPTTDEPTYHPTTDQPSLSPSLRPTTEEPTYHPTTDMPTQNPSKNPTTDMPTKNPSTSPSKTPSKSPTTDQPSEYPTRGPTFEPTRPPSIPPTYMPTRHPTFTPTIDPTLAPTRDPTLHPTIDEEFAVWQRAVAEELHIKNIVEIQLTFETVVWFPYQTEVRGISGRDMVELKNITESKCTIPSQYADENCQQWTVHFVTRNHCDSTPRQVIIDAYTVHVHNNVLKEEKQHAMFSLNLGTSSSWDCAKQITSEHTEDGGFSLAIETQTRLHLVDKTIEEWGRNYVLIMDRRVDIMFEFQSSAREIMDVHLQRVDITETGGALICAGCTDRPEYADLIDIKDKSLETKSHEYMFSFFVDRRLFEHNRALSFDFHFLVIYKHVNLATRRELQNEETMTAMTFQLGSEENPPTVWPKEESRSLLMASKAASLAREAEAAVASQTQVKQAEESFSLTDPVETPFGGIDSRIVLGFAALGVTSLSYFAISRLLRKSQSKYTQIDEHEEI